MTSTTTTLARCLLAIQQKPEEERFQDNWIPQSPGSGFWLDEVEEPSHAVTHPETEGRFFEPQLTQAIWNEGNVRNSIESMDNLVSLIHAFDNSVNPFERFALNDSYLEDDWSDQVTVAHKNNLIYTLHAYSNRLNLLHFYAAQDGITVNEESETGFWSFIRSVPSFVAGDLVLLDNGNLRIVWSEEDNESHLGLQFLGNDMVQYVIFKQRPYSRMVSRVAGRDSFKGIMKQIRTFALDELLEQV